MEEEFLVRKYASVLVARGNLKRTFHRAVSPLSEYEPDFVRVAKGMISQNSMHDVILVDKVMIGYVPELMNDADCFHILMMALSRELLKKSILSQ